MFGKKSNILHDFNSFRGGEKDRVLTNSKTIWTLVSWHKTIALAELWPSSGFDNDEI